MAGFTLPQYDRDDPWDFVAPDTNRRLERIERACRTRYPVVSVSVGERTHEVSMRHVFDPGRVPDDSADSFASGSLGDRTVSVPHAALGPPFCTDADGDTAVALHCPERYVRLADVCHLSVGMVSGYERAFRLDEEQLSDVPNAERDGLIRVVKGEHTDRYTVSGTAPFIHVPDVESAGELQEHYPTIHALLEPHRDRLEERYDYGTDLAWFHWAFPRNRAYFERHTGPKLFVPTKDRTPHSRYGYCAGAVYGTQDTVSLAFREAVAPRANLKYVAALLNSPVLDAWYDEHGIQRGHVTQYSKEPMSDIPIRLVDWDDPVEVTRHDRVVELIDEILRGRPVEPRHEEVTEHVADLYALDAVPTRRRD